MKRTKRFMAILLMFLLCVGEIGSAGINVFAAESDVRDTDALFDVIQETDTVSCDTASGAETVIDDESELDEVIIEETDSSKEDSESDKVKSDGVTSYNIWIGDTQVTSANASNIPGVTGDGAKASYNAGTKTLTLTNVSGISSTKGNKVKLGINGTDITLETLITVKGNGETITINADGVLSNTTGCGIYAEGVNLSLKGNIRIPNCTYGLLTAASEINFDEGSFEATGNYGIYIMTYGGNQSVNFNGMNIDAASTHKDCAAIYIGQLIKTYIKGGNIYAHSTATDSAGIILHTLEMTNGMLVAESTKGRPVKTHTTSFKPNQKDMCFVVPAGGYFEDGIVVDKDGNPVTRVVAIHPTYYPLWVGTTQVSDVNKDNIECNSGTASYDPKTKTLTFGEGAELSSVFSAYGKSCPMSADDDITFAGTMTINQPLDEGIYLKNHKGTFNGDFTFYSGHTAINAGSVDYIGGNTKITTWRSEDSDSAIKCSTFSMSGGTLEVDVAGGVPDDEAKGKAIYASGGITLGENIKIVTPKNGKISSDKTTIVEADGVTPAKKVKLKYVVETKYDLWVGGTQVTDSNKSDILGDGTASFNPSTNTLTFNNATITTTYTHEKSGKTMAIRSENMPLTIKGTVNINVPDADFAIIATDTTGATDRVLTVDGDITTNGSRFGIIVGAMDLYFKSGTVQIKNAKESAVEDEFGGKIKFGDGMTILSPANATVKTKTAENGISKYTQIYESDQTTVVKTATIGVNTGDEYDLWVGGTRVTKDNKSDILGDGKASYDPSTGTLTFNDATITDGYEYSTGFKAGIYSRNNALTIKGKVNIESTALRYGIYCYDLAESDRLLTLAGDISIRLEKAASIGITTYNKKVSISGNNLDIQSAKGALNVNGDVTLGAGVKVKSPEGAVIKVSDSYSRVYDSETGNTVLSNSVIGVDATVVTHTVTFDPNAKTATDMPAEQVIGEGGTATAPDKNPKADGFVFKAWCTDKAGKKVYDFATPVKADLTLYASWTKAEDPAPTPLPGPLVGGESALDPVPELKPGVTTDLYLVKGQKFNIGQGWYIDKNDKDSKKKVSINKKGLFKAKAAGEAVIKCGAGDTEWSVNLHISTPKMNKKSLTLTTETATDVKTEQIPLSYDDEHLEVFWYSANPDVVTVDNNGTVRTVGKGSSVVTAYIKGSAYTCKVTVKEKVALQDHIIHMAKGTSKSISIKGLKNPVWTPSTPGIVTVKKNKITADATGTTVLSFTQNDTEYKVYVCVEDVGMKGVLLKPQGKTGSNKYQIDAYKTRTQVQFERVDVEHPVVFKSNKPDIAFIDEGLNIVMRGAGKAKFTAKVDGKTITINVNVKQ